MKLYYGNTLYLSFMKGKKKIRKTFASSKRLDPPPFFYEKNEMETAFISFEFHLKTM